ncbi:hypothetical protein BVY04_01545 [bacterium M21]|nr:hypothetical protein BVY04_01545 [bacterium M21]
MSMTHEFEQTMNGQSDHWAEIPVIDMHLHFVDFMQRTDGIYTQREGSGEPEAEGLIESMNEGNIAKNIVFGLPVKKKWESFEPIEPSYYLGDNSRCTYFASTDETVAFNYLQLTEEDQPRIAPTLVGFDPTDMSAIEYVEQMFAKYPFWKGIGEVLLRHDDLTNLTIGEIARANHPAMTAVYKFCEDNKLPICIHQNSTNVASSVASAATPEYHYLHELKEVLENHPDLLLVWAHCGISRRVEHPEYYKMVHDMLRDYPNLHVDFSWVAYENVICEPRANDSEPLIPKIEWIEEVILPGTNRFRIMLGSDLCGHFSSQKNPYNHAKTMARYNGLLRELRKYEEGIDQLIAFENADRIYFQTS